MEEKSFEIEFPSFFISYFHLLMTTIINQFILNIPKSS